MENLENKKLPSGQTYGEWADEKLAAGHYRCTREELIQFCQRQQAELENMTLAYFGSNNEMFQRAS